MAKDDVEDLLSGTVEEVKEAIRESEDPDIEALLDAEKEGEDRKTVKEFLESRMDEDESSSDQDEAVSPLEKLSSYQMFALGLLAGLVIGGFAAFQTGGSAYTASPESVSEDVKTLIGQSENRTIDLGEAKQRNGMYYFNISISQETVNGTQVRNQELYVSSDGKLLFPKVQSFLVRSPIEIDRALSQRANATR